MPTKLTNTPTISQNKMLSVKPMVNRNNCIVYVIHQTQGAEDYQEAEYIAKIMTQALNDYLKREREK